MTKEEIHEILEGAAQDLEKNIGDVFRDFFNKSASLKEQQEVQDYRKQMLDLYRESLDIAAAQASHTERIANALESIASDYNRSQLRG